MTIAKGQPWGRQGPLDAAGPVAATDAELARVVAAAVLAGDVPEPTGLIGGDLFSTLGGKPSGRRPTDEDAWWYPLDALVVRSTTDGVSSEPAVAVAHVVAFRAPEAGRPSDRLVGALRGRRHPPKLRRAPWFVDETLIIANAAFVGDWNIAPRGHPNDGRLEVTQGRLGARDRRQLAGRLAAGTHLPHPGLTTSRPKALDAGMGPWRLYVDGVDTGMVDDFGVELIPDAFTAVM